MVQSNLSKPVLGILLAVVCLGSAACAKPIDGLLCRDKAFAEKVRLFMPDRTQHGKTWHVETLEDILAQYGGKEPPTENLSWKNYCEEQFGAAGITLEFPWFGRNAAVMRRTGADALHACLLAYLSLRM